MKKLVPNKKIGKYCQYVYGFTDDAGNWIIDPIFGNVKPFHNGLAFVEDDRCLWGVIDTDGNWVVEPTFSHIWKFIDGIAVAATRREEGENFTRCGYIDAKGGWIIPPRFWRALPFENGIAKVMECPRQEWKYIDKRGNEVVTFLPSDFSESFKIETEEYEGQINPKGGWIVGPFFKMPEIPSNAEPSDIILKGDCRHEEQTATKESRMDFTLTAGGVLTISGNDWLCAVDDVELSPNPHLDNEIDEKMFRQSMFKNLDFHTVVIEKGVWGLREYSLAGCKNLKQIVINTDEIIHEVALHNFVPERCIDAF